MDGNILDIIFNFELENIANRLGLINEKVKDIEYKQIIEILNYIDEKSLKKESINRIIAICAIINEYYGEKYNGIKNIIERILSRIGYYASANVLNVDKEVSILSYLQVANNNDDYKIKIQDKEFILTEFQMKIWKQIENKNKVIAISAPTSSGKSFIITLKLMEIIQKNNYDIVYVVPTISLVNQVMQDFKDMMQKFNILDYDIENSYIDEEANKTRKIYVFTQEKLMQALTNFKNQFTNDLILVIDEIQNIEKVSADDEIRSKILLDSINDIKENKNVKKIVISGPRINSINKLGDTLFGKKNTVKVETKRTPVLNLTYSIKKNGRKYYLKQYNAINNKIYSVEIKNTNIIKSYDKITYNDDYYNYLYYMINNFGKESKNIIFSPTAKESFKTAKELGERVTFTKEKANDKINELIQYYKESVHERYLISDILDKNIVYHNGKMPRHVRVTLEYAIKKEMINNVVCTTTLMQGVNLPAQNIIIRNPHLYTRSNVKNELSSYDMANLRGRAGRLLKDFIGRTFVYNEDEFIKITNEYDEENTFSNTSKTIAGDYSEIFNENKDEILRELNENIEATDDIECSFLTTYIRYMILTNQNMAKEKLEKVGIRIDNNEITKIKRNLNSIKVPIDICKKNRYIDPFVLNKMYLDENLKKLVFDNLQDKQANKKVRALLKYIREDKDYKKLFERNIPKKYSRGMSLTILCSKIIAWSKGIKLKNILGDNINENYIDDEIALLETTISYNIPTMLKPIYDIYSPESTLLNSIELGSCNPLVMCMIKLGIARETSIFLYDQYFKNINVTKDKEENQEEIIKKNLRNNLEEMPYWIRIQLQFIL